MSGNDSQNPVQGNSFFSGFLLGALVGAAIVFLFGTKKGKKLLEIISKEGVENISDILDETKKLEEPQKAASPLRPAERDFEEQVKKENVAKVATVDVPRPKVRRFFRGVSRHLN